MWKARITGPSTTRPELNLREHDYIFLEDFWAKDYLTDNLELCTGAIKKVSDTEFILPMNILSTGYKLSCNNSVHTRINTKLKF